jgi:DNA-binding Lrp family transcriptional regulator
MGKERQALDALRKTPGMVEAHLVLGEYDIMVLIEVESMRARRYRSSMPAHEFNKI